MIERLFPDIYMDSAYDIDLELLSKHNIKGLILDIDNTLVPMFQKKAGEQTGRWLRGLNNAGIKTIVLSNARYERAELFCRELDIQFIHKASKPSSRGFIAARKLLGLPSEVVAIVGDQIFTDVIGGNRVNMFTIMVKPINPKELFTIRLKRILEKPVLFYFRGMKPSRKLSREKWKRNSGKRLDK